MIVCKDSEREIINRVCQQLGQRIQGLIVQSQLVEWYNRALRGDFSKQLATDLLRSLRQEYRNEFPFRETLRDFYKERGYQRIYQPSSPFWLED
ncbi:MAG TPA: HaeII family restriction endonuclease [Thermoflexia bacterium]|nr:HaeII family restriction endonuclease [Thermoflexia bacterium]